MTKRSHDDSRKTKSETPIAIVLERLDQVEGRILKEIVAALAPAKELEVAVRLLEVRIIEAERRLTTLEAQRGKT